jgi:uncharacterized damage-inducible protein DinB
MIAESANYLERIEDLRSQVSGLIADLPTEALNWRPLEGQGDHATNSLAVLAAHIAGGEHFWIGEVVGNHPKTRDRDAEFAAVANNAAELIHLLEKNGPETKEVLSTLNESELNGTRQARDRIVPVRWCVLHVIDHASLHLGHMQITYQLWAGGKSMPSPPWFERLRTNQQL